MADFWQAGNLLLQRERAKAKEKLSSKLRQKPGAIDQTTLLQQRRLGKKTGVAKARQSHNSGF
jgi:hypothetical protein